MSIFAKPPYESEFTQFLNAWKQRDPELHDGQLSGLARLWDKPPIDEDERQRMIASVVRRPPYVYE